MTEKFEIDIIELPKTVGREEEKGKLMDWLMFLENPNSERIEKTMSENKEIKKAKEELKKISNDEKMQRLAEWREKYVLEHNSAISSGREEGREEGLKEGIEKGREKGIKEGREKGIKEGRTEGIKEIAKKMKEEKIDIETIKKITGLTGEKIEKL